MTERTKHKTGAEALRNAGLAKISRALTIILKIFARFLEWAVRSLRWAGNLIYNIVLLISIGSLIIAAFLSLITLVGNAFPIGPRIAIYLIMTAIVLYAMLSQDAVLDDVDHASNEDKHENGLKFKGIRNFLYTAKHQLSKFSGKLSSGATKLLQVIGIDIPSSNEAGNGRAFAFILFIVSLPGIILSNADKGYFYYSEKPLFWTWSVLRGAGDIVWKNLIDWAGWALKYLGDPELQATPLANIPKAFSPPLSQVNSILMWVCIFVLTVGGLYYSTAALKNRSSFAAWLIAGFLWLVTALFFAALIVWLAPI